MGADSMKRRNLLAGLGTAPIAPRAAAQPARPLLVSLSPTSRSNDAAMRSVHRPFKETLFKLGCEPGRNIDIVERFAAARRRRDSMNIRPSALQGVD
jgi:hypothetical protein